MGPRMRTALVSVGVATAAIALGSAGAQAEGTSDTTIPADTILPADAGMPADADVLIETVECTLLVTDVERGTATFTVGPAACVGEVGPISFSAFFLPGGMREPYEDQVLIAHHESNGAYYGAGDFVLTIAMGTPCNWQTDLYFGVDLMPKFRGLIAYDYDEREVCQEETTTTTSIAAEGVATTTTTTTTIPTTIPNQAVATTTTTTPALTTTTEVAASGGGATTTSVASAGPIPVPEVDDKTLPSTGSSEMSILAMLGGILVAAGLFVRRFARY